ncbi:hypothetical protein BD779DRAFT_1666738 [Infundibulicybe gibba]|nr:hypothetical protein BD779DRAFT_1666738 [Infundibulicybe gibba]
MSDEIAQDEEDAEDYDLESLEHRTQARDDDDDATLVGGRRGPDSLADDRVVFEIGDEDGASDDDENIPKKRPAERLSGENHHEDERQGLIAGGTGRVRND